MIKHIIRNVIQNRVIAIIFILQVILSVVIMSDISYQRSILNVSNQNTNKINVDLEKVYTFNYLGFFDYKNHKAFMDDMKNYFGEENLGMSLGPTVKYIESIPNEESYFDKMIKLNSNNFMGDYYNSINSLVISNNILEKFDIKIVEGNNLSNEDFQKDSLENIPILASEEFLGILKVGDKITAEKGRSYIIKGFFDSDINWFGLNKLIGESQDFTSLFIEPFVFIENNDDVKVTFNGLMLFNETKLNSSQVKEKIDEIAYSNGISIVNKYMKDELDLIKSESEERVKTIYFMSAVSIILMLFGISTVVVYSIKCNMEKIGIYKTVGFSNRKIKIIMLSQWILYIIIGAIISLGCIWIKNNTVNEVAKYDNQILIYDLAKYSYVDTMFISLMLIALISIIVWIASKKIDKLQVSSLIGGRY